MPGPLDRITGAFGSLLGRGRGSDAKSEPEEEGWAESRPEAVEGPEAVADDDMEDSVAAPEPEEPEEPEPQVAAVPEPPAAAAAEPPTATPEHHGIRQDEGLPTAPSIGPHTHIEHVPPEERLAGHEYSDLDAMGLEKRRQVVGGSYSPTRTRIVATFATFFAVVAVLGIGFFLLAKELDQPPESNPDEAPWSAPDAPQNPVPKLQ